MNVTEVLSTSFDQLALLHSPIMVVGLRGWFDVAEVATGALAHLLDDRVAPIVASIDPDPFFDFTQSTNSGKLRTGTLELTTSTCAEDAASDTGTKSFCGS